MSRRSLFLFVLLLASWPLVLFSNALYVFQPCCYDFHHTSATFGPRLPYTPNSGVRGDLILLPPAHAAACSTGAKKEDEEALKALVQGQIVLVSRGECSFASKIFHMQKLGAHAVVVHDNDPENGDRLIVMAKDDQVDGDQDMDITIPSIFVSYHAGIKLREEIVPAKVDLFRADEEWIGPMMDVPAPLLLVFTFIMFTLSFVITASFLRACCRLRHAIHSSRQYVINNRGLLEPLGSNVVIVDGSAKEDEEENEQVYFVPLVLDSPRETAQSDEASGSAVQTTQDQQQQNEATNGAVTLQVNTTDSRVPILEREQQTQ